MTRRSLINVLFHSGVLWGVLFTVGFVEFTSGSAVLAFGCAGLGALGVWSARRRIAATGSTWFDRHDDYLMRLAHVLLIVFAVRVGATMARELVTSDTVSPHGTWWVLGTTLFVVGITWLADRYFSALLALASVGVAAVIGWVSWSVLVRGGFRGNHLATVTGSGASLAMTFRGIAVAAVSFTVIDSVMVRWRQRHADDVDIFRPTLIAVTGATMVLAYVMVTAAGPISSHIPYVFPVIAQTYSGETASRAAEGVAVVLMISSAAVMLRGLLASVSSSLRRRGVVAIVALGALVTYPVMDLLQAAATLIVVSWLVVTSRRLLRVSEAREPWYEWIPPTCGATVAALGLYGVLEQHLSLDQRSGAHHLIQLLVLLTLVVAFGAVYTRHQRRRQGPRPIPFRDQREIE